MSGLDVRSLLDGAGDGDLDLWAKTINPQFVRVLRTIGFDRPWARAEGAYLYDTTATLPRHARRLRDVQRRPQQPRVRAALSRRSSSTRRGRRRWASRSPRFSRRSSSRASGEARPLLFTNSGTEAVEAALKLGRAATGRARVVSTDHGFHGLTLGSLSANGNPEFTDRFGPLLPGFIACRSASSSRSRRS